MRPPLAHVATAIARKKGHILRRETACPRPEKACQRLVARDGMTMRPAAFAGGISDPSRPIATVGSPMPATPLIRPATTKVSETATIRAESVMRTSLIAPLPGDNLAFP